jgi:hypothetical protein
MIQYAPSFQIVPNSEKPGTFRLWVGYSIWDGDQCTKHITLYNEDLPQAGMCTEAGNLLAFAMEIADQVYQSVSSHLGDRDALSVSDVNARPSDTSIPSSL